MSSPYYTPRWNQALTKDQNIFGGPLFLPGLPELTTAIRRLAEDVSERMIALEERVHSQNTESEMSTLNNMKNCVQSSAKLASTASSWSLSTDAAESVAASDLIFGPSSLTQTRVLGSPARQT